MVKNKSSDLDWKSVGLKFNIALEFNIDLEVILRAVQQSFC